MCQQSCRNLDFVDHDIHSIDNQRKHTWSKRHMKQDIRSHQLAFVKIAWNILQLAPQVNPFSIIFFPVQNIAKKEINKVVETSQKDVGVRIPTTSFKITDKFRCAATDLYRALTDKQVST